MLREVNEPSAKAMADIPNKQDSTVSTGPHFKDWPNDLGFNYLPQNNGPTELKVTGSFPSWAAGDLVRIGPGVYKLDRNNAEDGVFKASHWFDGFTTCHKFSIRCESDGAAAGSSSSISASKVTYMSKGQVDEQLEQARSNGRLECFTFGQKRDPCDSFYKKMKTFFTPVRRGSLTAEITGVTFAPALHAPGKNVISTTSDKSLLKEIDIETLEPKTLTEQSHLNPALKGNLSAAHPEVDPESGDVYNYNLDMGPSHVYRVFRTRASDGKTEVLATISGSSVRGSYIHSLFLSGRFVVLCVWPAYFGKKGISILWERNLLDAIDPFDKSAKCTWYVVDRVGGRGVVKEFSSPAMFSFHTCNAWEEEEEEDTKSDGSVVVNIIAELCQFESTDILHKFYYENLVSNEANVLKENNKKNNHSKMNVALTRYRLAGVPLSTTNKTTTTTTKKGTAEQVFSLAEPLSGDLPTFNPAYKCRPSRYVYGVVNRGLSSFIDAIGKTDTETGTCKLWSHDKHTPGEPIFVPNPEAKSEDDGVLLVVVLDGLKGTSYLLCLDAVSMEEVARAECEVPVSFGFHGIHLKAPSSLRK